MYITQCLITKNEEENIVHCLSHLQSVVDEQIVVDTGSTDRTVEIAEKLGAKVFHFNWINDFSAARNFALEKAKGEWIIFLDCDEYFSEDSIPHIKNLINSASKMKDVNGVLCEMINIDEEKNIISTLKNISPRIFRNKSTIKYKNKIHEILTDKRRKEQGYSVLCMDDEGKLKIYHTGYSHKVLTEKNKNMRNINLLKEEILTDPKNSQLHYYLSKQYYINKEYSAALEHGLLALEHMDNTKELEYYPSIFSSIMLAMLSLSKPFQEIKSIFDKATERYPKFPDYYRFMGLSAYKYKKIKEAIEYLEKCLYYCNNYSGLLESLALGQIDRVYNELLDAYIVDNNKIKIVELSVALLNFNKYNLEILVILLKVLLTNETEKDILNYVNKIYDIGNFKDRIFLYKACELCNNAYLIKYYKGLLSEEELILLNGKNI